MISLWIFLDWRLYVCAGVRMIRYICTCADASDYKVFFFFGSDVQVGHCVCVCVCYDIILSHALGIPYHVGLC